MEIDELKEVYDVSEVQSKLGLSRSNTYIFLEEVNKNQEPFRIIKIGKLYKVPKKQFNEWINGGSNNVQYK